MALEFGCLRLYTAEFRLKLLILWFICLGYVSCGFGLGWLAFICFGVKFANLTFFGFGFCDLVILGPDCGVWGLYKTEL